MKNLKITLSITALFIASLSIQATELQEQNAPTNQEALYQLELQSIDPSELQYQSGLINILAACRGGYPICNNNISNLNQPLETLSTSTQELKYN